MIESALAQQLLADPVIASLIATRLYPVVWPDDPGSQLLVTYQLISTVATNLLSGPLSLCTVRMQYDAWGKSYREVKAVTQAINNVLEGFQGGLPEGTVVSNIVLDSCFDLYDSPSLRYRVSSDYLVTYTRQ